MADKDPNERIWELMSDINIAMIVTHSGQGDALRARPMAAQVVADDHAVYFFTDARAPKDDEVKHNSNVCLTFADESGNNYVSVTGEAEVVQDAELAKRIWTPAAKAWFTGPDDPQLRILKVTPDKGEFWEGPGLVARTAAMAAAIVGGNRPKMGESEKVSM